MRSTPASLCDVGDVNLVQFNLNPHAIGGWGPGAPTGTRPVGLAFALACTGMGLPLAAPLRYEVIEAQVELVSKLVECPVAGPLRRRPEFQSASLNVRRLCSESVGLATAAALAYYEHGWVPANGWPHDLDLPPVVPGARPDLLFAVAGGQVAAEARGRSQGRRSHNPTTEQLDKLAGIAAWSAANGGIKTFMSWSWVTTHTTRTDYFDPGEPVFLVDEESLQANLRRRCRLLRESARRLDLDEHLVGDERILGAWIRPARREFEFFVGVRDPDAVRLIPSASQGPDPADRVTASMVARAGAVVGVIVTATRTLGEPIDVTDLVGEQLA